MPIASLIRLATAARLAAVVPLITLALPTGALAGARAPTHVAVVRDASGVVVSWSAVAHAQTYTIRASVGDGQRLIHTAYSTDLRRWRFGAIASSYGVRVAVCAATGARSTCHGPWRRISLRPHQRRAKR
jgi:hypothetical protein